MATCYPSPGASSAWQFDERPVCRHWKRGRCNAVNCNFPHIGPGGTSICRHFLHNRCNRSDCRFIHPGSTPMPKPVPWFPMPPSPMGFWDPRPAFHHPGFYQPYQAPPAYMQAPPFWAQPGYNTTFYPPPTPPYYNNNNSSWGHGSGYQNNGHSDEGSDLYEEETRHVGNNCEPAGKEEADHVDSAGVSGSEVAKKEEDSKDKEEVTPIDFNEKKPNDKGEAVPKDFNKKKPDDEGKLATAEIKKPEDKEEKVPEYTDKKEPDEKAKEVPKDTDKNNNKELTPEDVDEKKSDDKVEEPEVASPLIAMGAQL